MKNENKPFEQNCYKIKEAIKRNQEGLRKRNRSMKKSLQTFSKTDFLKTTTKTLPKPCVNAQAVLRGADTSAVIMTLEKNVSVYKENTMIKNRPETGLPVLPLAFFLLRHKTKASSPKSCLHFIKHQCDPLIRLPHTPTPFKTVLKLNLEKTKEQYLL